MNPIVDWQSDASHLLLNPRMPAEERARLEQLHAAMPSMSAHLWIATSGTTGAIKLTALSKRAVLVSAAAVNSHLAATSADVWACVLPTFHVGGLGIHARAHLTRSRVVTIEWDVRQFVRIADADRVTLTSMVPTQVRDLVRAGLSAPQSLRAVIVGGRAMPTQLHSEAKALGWPCLPSYGLTEAASQIATATEAGPDLRILPHVDCRIEDGRIVVRSAALLTGYAMWVDGRPAFHDPKVNGWFLTEDRGELDGYSLRVMGRDASFIKVGGESVDLSRLDAVLDSVRGATDAALVAAPDERLGHVVHLAVAGDGGDALQQSFNARVAPFERARAVHRVYAIPRSALGKVRRKELTQALGMGPEALE